MTIVFKVSDNLKNKIIDYYKDKVRPKTPEFCSWLKSKSYSIPVRYWIFLCQVFAIFILCNRVYCGRIFLR